MASTSARRRRGGLRLLGSGVGVRSQAQVCFSERFLLLADPGTGLVPAAVCVVKLVLERSGITSLCTLRAGSWNHRAPTATSWAHGVNG